MSTESIISLVIVGLLIYLIVTQHVKLAKLLPGKAGDFLDDFKLNQSNATPPQVVDHAAIINAAANVVAAAQASPQVTAPTPAPHVNTMIENMLGRTPQTDAILDGRLVGNVGQIIGPGFNWPDPAISSQAVTNRLTPGQEYVFTYAPGPSIKSATPGHYTTVGSADDALVTYWVTDSAGNVVVPKQTSNAQFGTADHACVPGTSYAFHVVTTKDEQRVCELKLRA